MEIRKKILLYFSFTIILLIGSALFFIYSLFSQYREEEFQQRQKEKIKSTLTFLSEIKKGEHKLTQTIDRLTINDLYNEKLLIFNNEKKLIYSSIDDTPIPYLKEILEKLSPKNVWFEDNEKTYDIVGLYFQNEGNVYYGISKAHDKFGFSKLKYLKYILIITFILISIAVIFIAHFLSNKITKSLIVITKKINSYNFDKEYNAIDFKPSKNEISILAQQFNELMKRMTDAFSFQKHVIHHISHELKTPISILVSNFERLENENNINEIKELIKFQKEDTKNLSEIINSLLEIAKVESRSVKRQDRVRIDDLIFDIINELKSVYPDFKFSFDYDLITDEKYLILNCNSQLIKSAFINLMLNCIHYSSDFNAKIKLEIYEEFLKISFENIGTVIDENESLYIFQHFFRGKNSKGKRGFGLGLVLVHRIIELHNGLISYNSPSKNVNVFTILFPLNF